MARRKRQTSSLSIAQQLPTEVLLLIFNNVWTSFEDAQIDYFQDLSRFFYQCYPPRVYTSMADLCRVCRNWLPPARQILFRSPYITSGSRLRTITNTLLENVQLQDSVKAITLHTVDSWYMDDDDGEMRFISINRLVNRLLPALPRLQQVRLAREAVQSIGRETFQYQPTMLSTLCISRANLESSMLSSLPSCLQKLSLTNVQILGNAAFPHMPVLHSLKLRGAVTADTFDFDFFFRCPVLDTLYLHEYDMSDYSPVQSFLSNPFRYRKLWIKDDASASLEYLPCFRHLQELYIEEFFVDLERIVLPRTLQILGLRAYIYVNSSLLFDHLSDPTRFPHLTYIPRIMWCVSPMKMDSRAIKKARQALAYLKDVRHLKLYARTGRYNIILEMLMGVHILPQY